jgi:iron(III) transport system ATP-binding protein
VFVTHDQEEAFALGDEIAVLRDGRIVQQATPSQLYRAPADPWVAQFVGDANLVPGRSDGSAVATVLGTIPLAAPGSPGEARVLVRPEHLHIVDEHGVPAIVRGVEYYGHDSVVRVDVSGTVLKVRLADAPPEAGRSIALVYGGPPSVAWPM